MTRFRTAICAITLAMTVPAAAQSSKPPLREVPEISNGIFTLVVANQIRRICDDIDGRLFKGIGQARKLRARANDLGYPDDEIRSLLNSDAEKARMIDRGKTYMADKGLNYDTPGDLCQLGHIEMKNNSAIGALLRAK